MNYRLIATQLGDLLKYSTSVNEIDRIAKSIFRFPRADFPNDSITSVRAKLIYDWILSLATQRMEPEIRNQLLIQFCRSITPNQFREDLERLLKDSGGSLNQLNKEDYALFSARNYHQDIIQHCRELFLQGNYFHAVFEAAKAYNKDVRIRTNSSLDGANLMLSVWSCDKGVLKITPCQSETDINVQDGIKFLSAGLMRAIRNPTAHEPASHWPISKQDCLDILSFVSFLYRQLKNAVFFQT